MMHHDELNDLFLQQSTPASKSNVIQIGKVDKRKVRTGFSYGRYDQCAVGIVHHLQSEAELVIIIMESQGETIFTC